MTKRVRNWVFTKWLKPTKDVNDNDKLLIFEDVNDPNDIEWLKKKCEGWNVEYCIYQLEQCPKTNNYHIQGYIRFKNPRTLQGVKNLFNDNTMHLDIALGDDYDNEKYCSKDNTKVWGPLSYGKPSSGQGKRTDLDMIKDMIKDRKNIKEIANENFEAFLKYSKGIEKYKMLMEERRNFKTKVIWIYGKEGVGKSKMALEMAQKYKNYYEKESSNKWFDGYDNEECVIINDYKFECLDEGFVLRLFDRYDMNVEIKGSMVKFNSICIIVTSVHEPMFYFRKNSKAEVMRRIDELYELRDENIQDFTKKEPIIMNKINGEFIKENNKIESNIQKPNETYIEKKNDEIIQFDDNCDYLNEKLE